ncbi:hypothetical protein RDABS01_015886 [Bienertia sinuspersici]
MAREASVCHKCYKNCLLLHRGKYDHPQKVFTFFKVMFGKRFSELLSRCLQFVPPKHSKMLTSLVGKKSYLEDSTGHEWAVVLSNEEGCLAFKEGWPKFYADHKIEQGDFVVFHFTTGSHFVVTVYGRSGWEKAFSGERSYQNKRPKDIRNSTTEFVLSDSFPEEREPQVYNSFDADAVSHSDTESDPSQVFGRSVWKKTFRGELCYRNKTPETARNSTTKKIATDSFGEVRIPQDEYDCFNTDTVPRSEKDSITNKGVGRSGLEKTFPGERIYQNKRPETARNSTTKKIATDSFGEVRILQDEYDCFNTDTVPRSEKDSITNKGVGRSGLKKTFPGERIYQNKRPETARNSTAKKIATDSFVEEQIPQDEYDCFNTDTVPRSEKDSISNKGVGRSGLEKTFSGERIYQNKRPIITRSSSIRKHSSDLFHEEREPWHKFSCFNADGVPQSDSDFIPSQGIGRSGLEKAFSGERSYQNKGPKTTRNFTTKKLSSDLVHEEREPRQKISCFNADAVLQSDIDSIANEGVVNNVDKPLVAKNVPKAELIDEPCFLTDKKTTSAREDDREHLLDLSAFELPDMKPCFAKKGDKNDLFDLSNPKKTDKELYSNHIGDLRGGKCFQEFSTLHEVQAENASNDTERPKHSQGNAVVPSKEDEAILLRSECSPVPSVPPALDMPLHSPKPLNIVESKAFEPLAASGGKVRFVKQEPKEFGQELSGNMEDNAQNKQVIKSELVDCCDSASSEALACSISPDNESFLELPKPLPLNQRQIMRPQRLIFLRNPAGNDWPVIYHNKNGVRVLASGWDSFRKANNICVGDECVFMVNNLTKGIFRVYIFKR